MIINNSAIMDQNKLKEICRKLDLPKYRVGQIWQYYYHSLPQSWDDFSILAKDLRKKLAEEIPLSSVMIAEIKENREVVKFLLEVIGVKQYTEAVVIKNSNERNTLCLSVQSGCPLGCKFCASGTLGLKHNLSAEEIVDSAREVMAYLKKRKEKLTNIVYMGMGEPFLNYQAVSQSLQSLNKKFDLGWRRLTVSTSGIVPKILQFASDFPQVNLAISLNAAEEKKRSFLMPVNKQYPLQQLMQAAHKYVAKTGRKLFFEYIVIQGFNDSVEDVKNLKKLIDHKLFHLNLIRFHLTQAAKEKYKLKWKTTSEQAFSSFQSLLKAQRINFTVRKSYGLENEAACGMLALKGYN